MKRLRSWRRTVAILAYIQVVWNLVLFAIHPAWGSVILACIWLLSGGIWTALTVNERRRMACTAQRHEWLIRPQPRLPDPFKGPQSLGSLRERMTPLPAGWRREESSRGIRYIQECTHWPRDEVKLNDGTVAAYICRRCDHNWANEDWILS